MSERKQISCWRCPRIWTRVLPNLLRWVVAWVVLLQLPLLLHAVEVMVNNHFNTNTAKIIKLLHLMPFYEWLGMLWVTTIESVIQRCFFNNAGDYYILLLIIGIPSALYLIYFARWLHREGQE